MRRNEDVEFDFPKTETWQKIGQELVERDILIFELQAFESKNRITLTGAIGSIRENEALDEVVKRHFPHLKLFNKTIVTAPFRSANHSHFDVWPDDIQDTHP
ncbi:hypothetical protein [Rhizobium sp. MHM7A]|uniref:hypothetical protein n=1 Tax=Rhizobium sp. MHM7A TaxID=2583233 RepID=UPI0011065C83|nr:hypothetical protein [Rhizobium sp. MHM7A]TLX16111.1 hypothetical protein FFR93_01960 [Rhizobium sp. MHM7A]